MTNETSSKDELDSNSSKGEMAMRSWRIACIVLFVLARGSEVLALDVVREGKPAAVIVVVKTPTAQETAVYRAGVDATGEATAKKGKGPKVSKKGAARVEGPDGESAELLIQWVKKMTGATLIVVDAVPDNQPAIVLGLAAQRAGLKLDDIKSPTSEGVRLRLDGKKILISGQRPEATFKAVCRFLEEFGCRVFMDGDIGEVYPRQPTLVVDKLDITEKPGFMYRRAAGPELGARRHVQDLERQRLHHLWPCPFLGRICQCCRIREASGIFRHEQERPARQQRLAVHVESGTARTFRQPGHRQNQGGDHPSLAVAHGWNRLLPVRQMQGPGRPEVDRTFQQGDFHV